MNLATKSTSLVALLVVSLGVAAASAACGGPGNAGPGPQPPTTGTPSETGSAGTAATTGGTTSGTTSAPTTTTSGTGSAQTPAPAFSGPMLSPKASMLVGDISAAGLDIKKLPPLDKIDPKVLRAKVMPLFNKSLGVKCGDCHVEGDFAAPTRRKKIAMKMWDEFVTKLSMDNGSPLFCDSCHQGRIQQLDRHDKKALSKWMQANFVDSLKRRDKKEHGCETCHGPDLDYTMLSKWGQL